MLPARTPMLLNELQHQQQLLAELTARLARLEEGRHARLHEPVAEDGLR
jgi:hypothetical protein